MFWYGVNFELLRMTTLRGVQQRNVKCLKTYTLAKLSFILDFGVRDLDDLFSKHARLWHLER